MVFPLVIHTCDSYEKWWPLWFFFYKKYVSGFEKVYFLTEEKELPFKSDEIILIKTGKAEWGQRLITALNQIEEKYIYYSQEDFWAKKNFNPTQYEEIFFKYKMNAFRITEKLHWFNLDHVEGNLFRFQQNSCYLMNHMFSLWDKNFFLRYVNPNDNPWDNETEQTKNISLIDHAIYLENNHWFESSVGRGEIRNCALRLINIHDNEICIFFNELGIDWFTYRKTITTSELIKKRKVAICMRGAVSNHRSRLITKNDMYTNTDYINYKLCYNSILKHIIEPNLEFYDIDIFQHCWNTDLQNELVKLYKPKAYIFENNLIYADEITKLCKEDNDFGGISHALSIKKSIEIKEDYELKNNLSYDIVISYRYDVFLWKDINLQEYNMDKIYIHRIICPWAPFMEGNGDLYFIMNNINSCEFKYLYDSVKINNPHKGHFWIRNYVINYMKKTMEEDNILSDYNIAVVRDIVEKSIHPGYLSIGDYCTYY